LELRHLRYFVAVAEERNFTRAAERLHIAQPPLSRQVHQLEELLDVELFVKGSRPLVLTEAGRFFYAHATELLAQSAEIISMTRRVGKIERKFSIGFVGSTLFGLLPEAIRRFKAANPDTEVIPHEMTTMEQIVALKQGVIDLGVVMREEALIVALPMGHPLASADRALYLRELEKDTLIVFPKAPRPSFADQVLAGFHDRALAPAKIYETRELQVALGLVAAGFGISIAPKSVLGMQRRDVCCKLLDEPNFVSPLILSIRAQDDSKDIKSFVRLVYGLYRSEGIPHNKESLGK
jgi:LysR family transcriptional regulator, benzoate and cis,cis-muconate-responsive activator of ben and cat genes